MIQARSWQLRACPDGPDPSDLILGENLRRITVALGQVRVHPLGGSAGICHELRQPFAAVALIDLQAQAGM
jgi:hypothetical protein